MGPNEANQPTHFDPGESTPALLLRVRGGDELARNQLVRRYLPALSRWARGRLPSVARDLIDTDDLVQESVLKALNRVEDFEPRREGAFLAYLRTIIVNRVRAEVRRAPSRPRKFPLEPEDFDGAIADLGPSPLEELVGREALDAYEAALLQLPAEQREAVILRLELGYTHAEVAEAIGSPSADAARMLVKRALLRMAEAMENVAES